MVCMNSRWRNLIVVIVIIVIIVAIFQLSQGANFLGPNFEEYAPTVDGVWTKQGASLASAESLFSLEASAINTAKNELSSMDSITLSGASKQYLKINIAIADYVKLVREEIEINEIVFALSADEYCGSLNLFENRNEIIGKEIVLSEQIESLVEEFEINYPTENERFYNVEFDSIVDSEYLSGVLLEYEQSLSNLSGVC